MHKWLSIALILVGCRSDRSTAQNFAQQQEKIKILATTAMVGDLVRSVGQDLVSVWVLIPNEVDPHSYELVRGDSDLMHSAHAVVYNGLGLEHREGLRDALELHPHHLAVGDAIAKVHPDKILHMDGQSDPHIWLDPSLWECGIDPLVSLLSEIDPEHSSNYQTNGKLLKTRLEALDSAIADLVDTVPEQHRYLVTSHSSFNYFVRHYLNASPDSPRAMAPEGLAPESQVSTADLRKTINFIRDHQIRVVFSESNVGERVLNKVIESCHAEGIAVTLAKDPLYSDAMLESGSYVETMEQNAQRLVSGWIQSQKPTT